MTPVTGLEQVKGTMFRIQGQVGGQKQQQACRLLLQESPGFFTGGIRKDNSKPAPGAPAITVPYPQPLAQLFLWGTLCRRAGGGKAQGAAVDSAGG